MEISPRYRSPNDASSRATIAAAVLVLGLGTTAATGQTTTPAATVATPSTTESAPVTNAQLQAQVKELREQVEQLKQAQKAATDPSRKLKGGTTIDPQRKKKPNQGMPMDKENKDAIDSAAPNDPPEQSMRKHGMQMMKKKHSMGMPSPSSNTPKDPATNDN